MLRQTPFSKAVNKTLKQSRTVRKIIEDRYIHIKQPQGEDGDSDAWGDPRHFVVFDTRPSIDETACRINDRHLSIVT